VSIKVLCEVSATPGGHTSLPKEGALRIFIARENQSLSAGSEPMNLGSNGKHDNHYTTENG
jgi:hypothetical protein